MTKVSKIFYRNIEILSEFSQGIHRAESASCAVFGSLFSGCWRFCIAICDSLYFIRSTPQFFPKAFISTQFSRMSGGGTKTGCMIQPFEKKKNSKKRFDKSNLWPGTKWFFVGGELKGNSHLPSTEVRGRFSATNKQVAFETPNPHRMSNMWNSWR